MSEILQSPQDVCLECLCFRVLAAMGEVLTEWVAGGVPPLGAFNKIKKGKLGAPLTFSRAQNVQLGFNSIESPRGRGHRRPPTP